MSEITPQDREDLAALDAKIKAILPPQYQDSYNQVQPVSMGSAALKYGPDGRVAWDDIWTSFCELALAGGPPHRGTLLAPVSAEEALAEPKLYQAVVEEMARGIWMVTELPVLPHFAPGWVGVRCKDAVMASWLIRAVVVENVSARHEKNFLCLPAGPHFMLAKEIKNVVTVMAKTCHYWSYHRSDSWTAEASGTAELLEPSLPSDIRGASDLYQTVVDEIEQGIRHTTGLAAAASAFPGWIRVPCASVEMAVWLMRAMVVENVIVRREEDGLFLPANVNFAAGDGSQKLVAAFARACRLWEVRAAV